MINDLEIYHFSFLDENEKIIHKGIMLALSVEDAKEKLRDSFTKINSLSNFQMLGNSKNVEIQLGFLDQFQVIRIDTDDKPTRILTDIFLCESGIETQ